MDDVPVGVGGDVDLRREDAEHPQRAVPTAMATGTRVRGGPAIDGPQHAFDRVAGLDHLDRHVLAVAVFAALQVT
jgi:hypothetical protein